MRTTFLVLLSAAPLVGRAQSLPVAAPPPPPPRFNVRLSLLLPFTPLLTVEARAGGLLTLQGETNFRRVHGLNVRYYLRQSMRGGFVFVGSALVRDVFLRADNRTTVLPYAGYGHAWPLGPHWTADARAGLGPAVNADEPRVYPVVKIGVGRKF